MVKGPERVGREARGARAEARHRADGFGRKRLRSAFRRELHESFKFRLVFLREEITGGLRDIRDCAGPGGIRALQRRVPENERFPAARSVEKRFFAFLFAGGGIAREGER